MLRSMESGTQEKLLSLMLVTEQRLELRDTECLGGVSEREVSQWWPPYLAVSSPACVPGVSVSESIVMEVVSPPVSGRELAGNCIRMV